MFYMDYPSFAGFFTPNLVLDLGIAAWIAAQVIKVFIAATLNGGFDIHVLLSSGGMPSSHSAFVCSITTAIFQIYGAESPLFALSVAFALVVMYDACNVRRAAGEQAKILNYLIEHWSEMSPELVGKELKELLGHTPLQVLMGAFLGGIIGTGGVYYFT